MRFKNLKFTYLLACFLRACSPCLNQCLYCGTLIFKYIARACSVSAAAHHGLRHSTAINRHLASASEWVWVPCHATDQSIHAHVSVDRPWRRSIPCHAAKCYHRIAQSCLPDRPKSPTVSLTSLSLSSRVVSPKRFNIDPCDA